MDFDGERKELQRNTQTFDVQLQNFEIALLNTLNYYGLPTASVFVSVDERLVVARNIEQVLGKISRDKRSQSVYMSKFIAATMSGLFDAALNYLWDETISELRQRVATYDLSFFCDNAGISQDKRNRIKSAEDLTLIEDSELINGARKIELISEIGYKHLDYIRYMRNYASAAHPNQNQLSGLQIVTWLETCIREVISLPTPAEAVRIKELLTNIKSKVISNIQEAKRVAAFFVHLNQEQINNLALGFFGIYVQPDTTQQTRQNIQYLLPYLWGRVDELTRKQLGVKYGKFVSVNDTERKNLARQFLEQVEGLSYIPEELHAIDLEDAIKNLLHAHRAMNNFYNEPQFARQLQRIVGDFGKIPVSLNEWYVLALVEVFLTNGYGEVWAADPIYRSLIGLFDAEQASIAILSFNEINISSRLQFPRCRNKYLELLELVKPKISAVALKELINDIENFSGPYDKMKDDSRIKRKVANLKKLIG